MLVWMMCGRVGLSSRAHSAAVGLGVRVIVCCEGLNDWRVSYPVVIVIFRTLTTQKNDLSQIACSGLAASVIWR